MKIEKLRIKNYRGIKDSGWIELDLLNAIVGKNDAGKSSILHAINSFYNENKLMNEDRYFGASDEETSFEIIFEGDELSEIPQVLLDEEKKLHVKKSANNVGDTYKNSIIVEDFCNQEYKNLFQFTSVKYNALFRKVGLEAPDKIEKSNVFELSKILIDQETTFELVEYEIKSSLLKNILKDLYPQYSLFLADTSLDIGASTFQNRFKKLITNAIETHISEFTNLQREVSETLKEEVEKIGEFMKKHYPSMKELKPNISYDWSKLVNFEVLIKDNAEYEVDMAYKGTGIQRLFMVSYFQYLAEQSLDESGQYVFALEEPETFLHPGAQRQLLDSLKKIAEKHQVIITTHSPVFASEINNKNIIVASKTNMESRYEQGESVSSESLVEELGVRASDNILNSKLLVFVEGSNDIRFWQIVYNAITGHNYEDDNILFIPGGGTELHNIAEMNLMYKLNRNFMVIVDKDAGAVDYEEKIAKQEKIRKCIEPKGGELLVLRKREIENYYCTRVIVEMLEEKNVMVDMFEIDPYEDVNKKMKEMFAGRNVQIKFKNNMEVFSRMKLEDWKNVSSYTENGVEHFELEEIVSQIRTKVL